MFSSKYHIQSKSTQTKNWNDCIANKQNLTCHNIPLKAPECGWGWSSYISIRWFHLKFFVSSSLMIFARKSSEKGAWGPALNIERRERNEQRIVRFKKDKIGKDKMIFVLYFYLKEYQYEPKEKCEKTMKLQMNKTVI